MFKASTYFIIRNGDDHFTLSGKDMIRLFMPTECPLVNTVTITSNTNTNTNMKKKNGWIVRAVNFLYTLWTKYEISEFKVEESDMFNYMSRVN
jgi:hypothetical protein